MKKKYNFQIFLFVSLFIVVAINVINYCNEKQPRYVYNKIFKPFIKEHPVRKRGLTLRSNLMGSMKIVIDKNTSFNSEATLPVDSVELKGSEYIIKLALKAWSLNLVCYGQSKANNDLSIVEINTKSIVYRIYDDEGNPVFDTAWIECFPTGTAYKKNTIKRGGKINYEGI